MSKPVECPKCKDQTYIIYESKDGVTMVSLCISPDCNFEINRHTDRYQRRIENYRPVNTQVEYTSPEDWSRKSKESLAKVAAKGDRR